MGNGSVGAAAGARTTGGATAATPSASKAQGGARGGPAAAAGGAKGRSFGDVLGPKGALASAGHGLLGDKEGDAGGHPLPKMMPVGASAAAGAAFAALAKGEAGVSRAGSSGHGRADARDDKERDRRKDALDPLDPAERHAAQLAPPLVSVAFASTTAAPAELGARASMESLLPGLVKKIAWSGDARKGTVRIELGAGPLEGGTLLVHADDGRLRVHLSAPAGADGDAWKERIEKRLTARGLDVESVVVE